MDKPYVKMRLRPGVDDKQVSDLCSWLVDLNALLQHDIIINVAGPRESRVPGLQVHVKEFLCEVIKRLKEGNDEETSA